MKHKLILSIILILLIFTGCGKEKSVEDVESSYEEYQGDDFNNGYCPDDHGEYVLTGVSRKFYHYKCNICGKEIKTKYINLKETRNNGTL